MAQPRLSSDDQLDQWISEERVQVKVREAEKLLLISDESDPQAIGRARGLLQMFELIRGLPEWRQQQKQQRMQSADGNWPSPPLT